MNCSFSGTTAVLAQINGNRLIVAWVGDSKAVLGRRTYEGENHSILLRSQSLVCNRLKLAPWHKYRHIGSGDLLFVSLSMLYDFIPCLEQGMVFPQMLHCHWYHTTSLLFPRSGTHEAVALTLDHKPEEAGELKRIVENNGRVERYESFYLVLNHRL